MSPKNSEKSFTNEFLEHYLKNGIGSMSKSDTDSLVMYLLDKYTHQGSVPLQTFSNQTLSETLRTPLSKIKRLRYEAGLKYGGRAEDEAQRRFLVSLSKATMEINQKTGEPAKITLIVEDILAKNWIQGHIKENGLVFDNSFNAEIIRVEPEAFFAVLRTLLKKSEVDSFEKQYNTLIKGKRGEALIGGFTSLLKDFMKGVAQTAGGIVATACIALPLIGS